MQLGERAGLRPANRLREVFGDAILDLCRQNPKVVVGCIPVWENQILICKRDIEPRSGYWTLPAGYLENDETLAAGAARERRTLLPDVEQPGQHRGFLRAPDLPVPDPERPGAGDVDHRVQQAVCISAWIAIG